MHCRGATAYAFCNAEGDFFVNLYSTPARVGPADVGHYKTPRQMAEDGWSIDELAAEDDDSPANSADEYAEESDFSDGDAGDDDASEVEEEYAPRSNTKVSAAAPAAWTVDPKRVVYHVSNASGTFGGYHGPFHDCSKLNGIFRFSGQRRNDRPVFTNERTGAVIWYWSENLGWVWWPNANYGSDYCGRSRNRDHIRAMLPPDSDWHMDTGAGGKAGPTKAQVKMETI